MTLEVCTLHRRGWVSIVQMLCSKPSSHWRLSLSNTFNSHNLGSCLRLSRLEFVYLKHDSSNQPSTHTHTHTYYNLYVCMNSNRLVSPFGDWPLCLCARVCLCSAATNGYSLSLVCLSINVWVTVFFCLLEWGYLCLYACDVCVDVWMWCLHVHGCSVGM